MYHPSFLWGQPDRRPGLVAMVFKRSPEAKFFVTELVSHHSHSKEVIGKEIQLVLDPTAQDRRNAVKLPRLDVKSDLYQTYKMVESVLQLCLLREQWGTIRANQ